MLRSILSLALVAALAASCQTTKKTKPAGTDANANTNAKPQNITGAPPIQYVDETSGTPALDPNAGKDANDFTDGQILDLNSLGEKIAHNFPPVYFGFDKASIEPQFQPQIKALAEFIAANNAYTLVVNGHSDEQGTEEYNRALSEKRALAVKEALIQAVPAIAERVNTQGYGEEKPAREGATETARSYNRRAEFDIYAKAAVK